MRSVSNTHFSQMKFRLLDIGTLWTSVFGELEEGFSMAIWGRTGEGKTTLAMRFLKDLSTLGKVYYNSHEQGMVGSLQRMADREGVFELPSTQWIWGNQDSVAEMEEKIKKNRCRFIVIDSRDSIQMTKHQFLRLKSRWKKKTFIVICWASGDKANGKEGQGIAYMSDVKVRVHRHTTYVRSRYGVTTPYRILGKPQAGEQLLLQMNGSGL